MKKRLLFIDRDGTLIREPSDEQVDSIDKIDFCPYVFSSMQKILSATDFVPVIVTNQDGLGTDLFPESTFWPAHNFMVKTFRNEGIEFYKEHIDPSLPEENSPNRKPGTGMLSEYFSELYDLENSFVIGDRLSDIKLAQNLGAKGILYNKFEGDNSLIEEIKSDIVLETNSWKEIADFLIKNSRTGNVERNTNETQIKVRVNLDGSGKSEISTGISFFDHMLDQLARHGGIDIFIETKGDLEVDEHHTIEDTAIALGDCFLLALGSKKGIERYGFMLPMDDCLAQVAIDFGGRSWIEWDAEFKREKIGEMPTEMFYHFFKSFSDSARCNLNIKAEGTNEHHKIESIFKAFARAIKMAIKRDQDNPESLPTTKGSI